MADSSENPLEETTTRRRSVRKTSLNSFVVQRNAKLEKKEKVKKVSDILKKPEGDRTAVEKALVKKNPDIVKASLKNAQRLQATKDRVLEIEDESEDLSRKCDQLAELIQGSSRIVIYTGAGISTAASIPDYRGPNGVWTLLKKGQALSAQDLSDAEPTFTHMSITKLFRTGRVRHVVSQNCDGLHIRSGYPRYALSEVHGNMFIECCYNCEPHREYIRLFDVTENTGVRRHTTRRKCKACGKYLTDTIVHFGEKGKIKSPYRWKEAVRAAKSSDLILCLGSSLKILRRYTCLWGMDKRPQQRPKLVIVNLQWTPKDDVATLKINGRCDEVMRRVMEKLEYNVPEYRREFDPIFKFCTPLRANEKKTTSKKILVPPSMPSKASVKAAVAKSSRSKKKLGQVISTATPSSSLQESEEELDLSATVKEEKIEAESDEITKSNTHSHIDPSDSNIHGEFKVDVKSIKLECKDEEEESVEKNTSVVQVPSVTEPTHAGVSLMSGNVECHIESASGVRPSQFPDVPSHSSGLHPTASSPNPPSYHSPPCNQPLLKPKLEKKFSLSDVNPLQNLSRPTHNDDNLALGGKGLSQIDSIGVLMVSQPPECLTDVCSLDLNSDNPSVFPVCRIELPAVEKSLLEPSLEESSIDEGKTMEDADSECDLSVSLVSDEIPSTVVVDLEAVGHSSDDGNSYQSPCSNILSCHKSSLPDHHLTGDANTAVFHPSPTPAIPLLTASGELQSGDETIGNRYLDVKCTLKDKEPHSVSDSKVLDSVISSSKCSDKPSDRFPVSPFLSHFHRTQNEKQSTSFTAMRNFGNCQSKPPPLTIPSSELKGQGHDVSSSQLVSQDYLPKKTDTSCEETSLPGDSQSEAATSDSSSLPILSLSIKPSHATSSVSKDLSPSTSWNSQSICPTQSEKNIVGCHVKEAISPAGQITINLTPSKMSGQTQSNSHNFVQMASSSFTKSSQSSSKSTTALSSSVLSLPLSSSSTVLSSYSKSSFPQSDNESNSHKNSLSGKLENFDTLQRNALLKNGKSNSNLMKFCAGQRNIISTMEKTTTSIPYRLQEKFFSDVNHGVISGLKQKQSTVCLENESFDNGTNANVGGLGLLKTKEYSLLHQTNSVNPATPGSQRNGSIEGCSNKLFHSITSTMNRNDNNSSNSTAEVSSFGNSASQTLQSQLKTVLEKQMAEESPKAHLVNSFKSNIISCVLNMDDLETSKLPLPLNVTGGKPFPPCVPKTLCSANVSVSACVPKTLCSANGSVSACNSQNDPCALSATNAQERAFSPESLRPSQATCLVSKLSRHTNSLELNPAPAESMLIPLKDEILIDTFEQTKSLPFHQQVMKENVIKPTAISAACSRCDLTSSISFQKPSNKKSHNRKAIVLKADWGTPLMAMFQQQQDTTACVIQPENLTAKRTNLKRPSPKQETVHSVISSPMPWTISDFPCVSDVPVPKKGKKSRQRSNKKSKETKAKSEPVGKDPHVKSPKVRGRPKTTKVKGVGKKKKPTTAAKKKKPNPGSSTSSAPGWFGKGLAIKRKRNC